MNETIGMVSLENVIAAARTGGPYMFPVTGDCMEAAGIENGGKVLVDFSRYPAPPVFQSGGGNYDVCLCYATMNRREQPPCIMCKAYSGVWGPWRWVSTRYDLSKGRHDMDCCFRADAILGAVIAAWGADGELKWQRDPSGFPTELGTWQTIKGENVGAPMPVRTARRKQI